MFEPKLVGMLSCAVCDTASHWCCRFDCTPAHLTPRFCRVRCAPLPTNDPTHHVVRWGPSHPPNSIPVGGRTNRPPDARARIHWGPSHMDLHSFSFWAFGFVWLHNGNVGKCPFATFEEIEVSFTSGSDQNLFLPQTRWHHLWWSTDHPIPISETAIPMPNNSQHVPWGDLSLASSC